MKINSCNCHPRFSHNILVFCYFFLSDLDENIKFTNKITNFFVSTNWNFGFQTLVSPVMVGIISFHIDLVIFYEYIFQNLIV